MTSATSTTRRVSQPAAVSASTQEPAVTGNPDCPKCGGPMWDNRDSKRNPRAPDFRCRNRVCDGVLWPGQHRAAVPIIGHTARVAASGNGGGDASRRDSRGNDGNGDGLSALRRCYLDVTEFVLSHVRDVYERHGVRWSAGAFASITATLFIAETKPEFWRQGYGSQATREGP